DGPDAAGGERVGSMAEWNGQQAHGGSIVRLNGMTATRDDLLALALINYGHFTTMRVDAGRIRGLSDHCARLVRDCRRLFGAELDPDRLRGYLRQTLHDAATGAGSFLVRVTVYDPGADLIRPDGEPAVLITLRPAGPVPAPPLRVQTVPGSRDLPEVKHVGLFGPLWHRREARHNGFDDALMIDPAGLIIEGTTWNVGFVIDDHLVWPAGDALPG